MKIAILSWGSLIESGVARGLRVRGGWTADGPLLPVEFSRISQSGGRQKCLTLVIDEQNGCDVQTHYSTCSFANLNVALMNLRVVENITKTYSIGFVNLATGGERGWARQKTPISCDRIKQWAINHQFDAVIWTSLLPNFEKILEIPFTVADAVAYVKSLPEPYYTRAKTYILSSPVQIITPIRSILTRDWMDEQAAIEESRGYIPPVISGQETHSISAEDVLMRFVNKFRFHR